MIIAATSDIHSPIWFDLFIRSLDNLKATPDLFLIAGDLIHKGQVEEMKKLSNAFFGKVSCPIISCFGNNEYQDLRENIKKQFKDFIFLEDEIYETEINGKSVGVLGTQGSIDSPTPWQKANIPDIEATYNERVKLIEDSLKSMKKDFKIFLSHYPPTFKIFSEDQNSNYPFMASSKLEDVLISTKPNLAITGHIHRGQKLVWVDSVPVFNVGLKLNQGIVVIDTNEIKPGLGKFIT